MNAILTIDPELDPMTPTLGRSQINHAGRSQSRYYPMGGAFLHAMLNSDDYRNIPLIPRERRALHREKILNYSDMGAALRSPAEFLRAFPPQI